ncbi:MAG TPA: hypothetical protein VKE74_00925, partial [Gemmataceae bacterium]|nr:hypothetical protein [Gemmataceae bacterium]
MATRRLWFPVLVLLGMALASASATSPTVPEYRVLRTQYSVLSTQQPPADPLPPGAKLRLGTTRMRDPGGWSGAVLTPDGQHLLAFPSAGPARIEVATGALGKPLKPPPGVFGGRTDLAPDGKRAVTVAFNGAVVWEIDTGASVARVDRRTPFGEGAAALSADGKTLAVGGVKDDQAKDKPVTALVWDIEKNAKRAEVIVLQNQSASVALSADGKLLATWGTHFDPTPGRPDPEKEFGRFVQFWDATSGKELGRTRLPGYGAPVVAFAPDGKMAAVANGTGTVLLVDPRTGSVGRQLFGRYGSGVRVAFSPDGKLLAAAASDGAVQVWQAADGKLAAT